METKAQKAALLQIQRIMELFESQLKAEKFKREVERRGYIEDVYHVENKSYCSLKELEKKLKKYLKEIEVLIEEYNLDKGLRLEFKKKALKLLYDKALERGDYTWAASFARKYEL